MIRKKEKKMFFLLIQLRVLGDQITVEVMEAKTTLPFLNKSNSRCQLR